MGKTALIRLGTLGLLCLGCGAEELPEAIRCSVELGFPDQPTGFRESVAGRIHLHVRPDAVSASRTMELAEGLETHRRFIAQGYRELYRVPPEAEVHFFLYDGREDKLRAFPCSGTGAAALTGYEGRYEAHSHRMSTHELVHVYTLTEPSHAWNQLLIEGLAVYWGDAWSFDDPSRPSSDLTPFFPELDYLTSSGGSPAFSLQAIHDWAPNRSLPEEEVIARYLSAGSFVRFLFEGEDTDLIRLHLAQELRPWREVRSQAHITALETTYGRSLAELESDWRAWTGLPPR
ncbi:MAG: hypothetical protein AAF627_19850 [Myxococcota bacterium]